MKFHNELKATVSHVDDITIRSLGIRIRAKRFSSIRQASRTQLLELRQMVEKAICSQIS